MSDESQKYDPNKSEIVSFREIPAEATMQEIVELARLRGREAFIGVQINVDGDIHGGQLDKISELLDSELTLVKLKVGTRIIAVGYKRDSAPYIQDFEDRGEVELHLHTHVPEEEGKPETLKKGPSTTDMRLSEAATVPLFLRTDGKTFTYKIPDLDDGRIMKELQVDFFGDPKSILRKAIDNPESDVHSTFWKIIDDMGVERSDEAGINELKDRYAEEQASYMIFRRKLNTTVEEDVDFAAFVLEKMTDPEWQSSHNGAYIREISEEDFNSLFNPPTITVKAYKVE